jgi:hypothetical protein
MEVNIFLILLIIPAPMAGSKIDKREKNQGL